MLRKILLVEDNADAREMLCYMLRTEGYNVIAAEDGLLGLRIAEAERPDLIITDINMPRMDGIRLIKRLREKREFRKVGILAMSAYGSGNLVEALRAGADQTIGKPLQFDSLLDCINQVLTSKPISIPATHIS